MFESVNLKKLKPYKLVTPKAWESLEMGNKNILKLDWNEASIPPSPKVSEELIKHINEGHLHWYPNTNNKHLTDELAQYTGLNESNLTYFGSSDVAHECIIKSFCSQDDYLLINAPTYDNFRVVAESSGANTELFFPKNIFSNDLEELSKKIESDTPKIVYICNPNNPTGVVYKPNEIEKLLLKFQNVLFIIDEAYYEFTLETCSHLTTKYENIIVTRTFSKAFALASFRVGYAISSPGIIESILKIRNPKNISALSQIAAITALKDVSYTHKYVADILKAKKWLKQQLEAKDFSVNGEGGNFLIVKTPNTPHLISSLMNKDIYVRDLSHLQNLDGYFRVTVGTMPQMEQLVSAINEIL